MNLYLKEKYKCAEFVKKNMMIIYKYWYFNLNSIIYIILFKSIFLFSILIAKNTYNLKKMINIYKKLYKL